MQPCFHSVIKRGYELAKLGKLDFQIKILSKELFVQSFRKMSDKKLSVDIE